MNIAGLCPNPLMQSTRYGALYKGPGLFLPGAALLAFYLDPPDFAARALPRAKIDASDVYAQPGNTILWQD